MIVAELEQSTCPACGARVVVGIEGSTRQRIILAPLPNPKGQWYFAGGGFIHRIREGGHAPNGVPRFLGHDDVCPQLEMFSKSEGEET